MIGASGAVMAVVVLYALYLPAPRSSCSCSSSRSRSGCSSSSSSRINVFTLAQRRRRPTTAVASHLTGALYGYLFKQFDLRWSRLPLEPRRAGPGSAIVPADPPREAARPRVGRGPTWSSELRRARRSPRSTAVAPRGTARRPARRGPRQDRPRRTRGADRGGEPRPPGGQPPRPQPPERPALIDRRASTRRLVATPRAATTST